MELYRMRKYELSRLSTVIVWQKL